LAAKQKGTYALLAILLLTATSVGMSVDGYPAGGDQQGAGEDWAKDSIAHGCSCHMDEQLDEGMYMINGIPTKYVPDTTYNISLVINDTNVISEPDALRYGGFLAEVNEGAFQTNELFWVGDDGTYISHNANTNSQRNWTFQWTAPSEGAGDALFTIYFNVVNGVGTNGDQWGYITAVSIGTPQIISEETSIHELGVSLMQYWIALAAFAMVFVMILIAYVVIRGGSSHYRG
tara:strand:+ start:475 stop:1170 length:696 start_codon:yes stop_codon:yes gene_type:complete